MNKILITIILLFLNITYLFSDDDPVDYSEIHINNMSTTQDIKVYVRPVGFIFDGKQIPNYPYADIHDYRYSPEAVHGFVSTPPPYNFLLGDKRF